MKFGNLNLHQVQYILTEVALATPKPLRVMYRILFAVLLVSGYLTIPLSGQSISFLPNSGQENSGFGVTVTGVGTNFNASTTCVEITALPGSIFFTSVSVTSPTLLTGNLSIPAGMTPGSYNARVYQGPGCAGTIYSCSSCFTITAAPAAITGSNPNSADVGQAINDITFTGINTNFNVLTDCVEILASPSTISLSDVNVVNATELNADLTVPTNTVPGSYDIRVYQGTGCTGAVYTCSGCFTINEPDISLSPNQGQEGSSFGVTVTGVGTNFNASTTCVEIQSAPGSIFLTGVSVTSPTILTGNLSVPIGTTAGTYNAKVFEGPGCSGTEYECFNCFTVTTAPPAIVGANPNNADVGESVNNITFTGINTNFSVLTDCVEILASPSTISLTDVNVVNSTELNADLAVPLSTTPGSYDIRIYAGASCTGPAYTCSGCFTIDAPTVSFLPNTGQENSTFGVTITGIGTNFDASTTCVEIKSSPASIFVSSISVASPTMLTGTVSVPIGIDPGTYDATVYDGPGCAGVEYDCFNCFTLTAAPPALIGSNPNDADIGESINDMTFTGINTNFNAFTDCVEILASPGNITLTDVNVISPTELTADVTIPTNTTPGSYSLRVYQGASCTGASYTCSNCFTINDREVSFTPDTGQENTSFGVTVTGLGTNFNASTTCVEIKASPSSIFLSGINVTSPTMLTGTLSVPIGLTAGTYDATVYQGPGCAGAEYDCFNCFSITASPPALLGSNPNSAQLGESVNDITFTGLNTNFNAFTDCVEILASPNTITLTDINIISTTELNADLSVPLNTTPGSYSMRIYEGTGCTGTSYMCTNCFTIDGPDIGFTPNTGQQNTSFGVTLSGTGTSFNASTTCVEILTTPSSLFLSGVSVSSPTLLTGNLSIPASIAAGTYGAKVYQGPGCAGVEYECFSCFTVTAAPPAIISVSPAAADVGQSLQDIEIIGINTNFNVNTDCVEILASPSTITLTDVTVLSSNELNADVSIPTTATPGTYDVVVHESLGCSGDMYICSGCFTIDHAEFLFVPSTGEVNTSFGVTISGSGTSFNASTTCVEVLASPASFFVSGVTVSSSTLLTGTASIPASTNPGVYGAKVYQGPGCTGIEYNCYSCFTVTGMIVPVEWLDFTAKLVDGETLLDWSTATEVNSAFFEIEHSVDAKEWKAIGEVTAAGNSDLVQYYSFIDKSPAEGVNYYRIKQHDIDGSVDYSPIRSIDYIMSDKPLLVYPNPTTGDLHVRLLTAEPTQNRDWQIVNGLGQVVLKGRLNASFIEESTQVLDLSNLQPGIYYLLLDDGTGQKRSTPFIKQ